MASFCGVDLKTIHNWANRGKIPGTRTEGRHLRFRRLDIVDFLRAFEFPLPAALVAGRPRVLLIETDAAALSAAHRALANRFDVFLFPNVVDGLVALAATDPDVALVGDIAPLEPAALAERLYETDGGRHVRVVAIGQPTTGSPESLGGGRVVAWVPPGDVTRLRDAMERVTGIA